MPKQVAPVEINSFVGGLVTDASPLTFPDNASLEEDNFILNTDGSRQRRLGMDFEQDGSEITTSVSTVTVSNPAHTSFKWDNAGGDPDKSLLAVQFGFELKFFDLDNIPLSSQVVHTHSFPVDTGETPYSYAVVDGILVVVNGEKSVNTFEYNGGTITQSSDILLMRDFFGVDVTIDGDNLRDSNNVTKRPTTKTDGHIYNLRNQTWAEPRKASNTETIIDPIRHFFNTASKYPSNADTVTQSLYSDAGDTDDRITERFFATDLQSNPIGSSHAPRGHYIIDALERGASRLSAIQETESQAPGSANMITVSSLPTDRTPKGATSITQYSGRIWYAGFSGEVEGGDDKSPRMSSYVLFSVQVEELSDIVRCYQRGDPTDKEDPDLIATDGGFVRIDEAYGIKHLLNLENTLFVFATNGVWRIEGDDQGGFKATGYSVIKVSDRGVRGAKSVVEVEGSVIYWGDDGIYLISKNQFGDWVSESMTENRLQRFYNAVDSLSKDFVQGYFDSFDKKVRWVYDNILTESDDVRELVLDKSLGAFYTNTIKTPSGSSFPKVVGIFETTPFQTVSSSENVTANGVTVTADSEIVTSSVTSTLSTIREIGYICITSLTPTIKYRFSYYSDNTFVDWRTVDGVGVDAEAFMVTGYLSGNDFQRQKQIINLTAYMRKTETGFVEDVNGDFAPVNESSCLISTRWDWTNSERANRWTTPREFYRHRRLYFPVDIDDTFDDGNSVVASRDKIRGKGRVLSIKFESSPGKNLHLYGWSLFMGIQSNV